MRMWNSNIPPAPLGTNNGKSPAGRSNCRAIMVPSPSASSPSGRSKNGGEAWSEGVWPVPVNQNLKKDLRHKPGGWSIHTDFELVS